MNKLILTFATVFIFNTLSAQVGVELGAGVSTKKAAVADVYVEYGYNNFMLSTGYTAHLSRNIDDGTYISIMTGYSFELNCDNYFIQPMLGYAYNLKSSDNKNLNKDGTIYSLSIKRKINDGILYIRSSYSQQVVFGTVGIEYIFSNY